jgi:hypothetical protein
MKIYDDKPTNKQPPKPVRYPLKDDGYIYAISIGGHMNNKWDRRPAWQRALILTITIPTIAVGVVAIGGGLLWLAATYYMPLAYVLSGIYVFLFFYSIFYMGER